MQSPELQQLTASEPLTLEQEYEMQQTWLKSNDSKKGADCDLVMKPVCHLAHNI
jgi:hypothetical protein